MQEKRQQFEDIEHHGQNSRQMPVQSKTQGAGKSKMIPICGQLDFSDNGDVNDVSNNNLMTIGNDEDYFKLEIDQDRML